MIASAENPKGCYCTTSTSATSITNCDCITIHQNQHCTVGHVDIEPEPIDVDILSVKHIIPVSGLRTPSLRKPPQPKYFNKHPRIKRSSSKG